MGHGVALVRDTSSLHESLEDTTEGDGCVPSKVMAWCWREDDSTMALAGTRPHAVLEEVDGRAASWG